MQPPDHPANDPPGSATRTGGSVLPGGAATFPYCLFGLRIASELELPTLNRAATNAEGADVVIGVGRLPDRLPSARFTSSYYDVAPGSLLLRIPNVASYLIADGREIIVDPAEAADRQSLELFLLGSALGALCHQRGLLPLHASAVDVGGECVAFMGPSGAGKSTLAAHLSARGYPLVCDDVCVVHAAEDGVVRVSPADARVKLWADGLDSMALEANGLRAVRVDATKYHVPVVGVASAAPLRLGAIYVLAEQGVERSIERLQGFEAVLAIASNTYRAEFIEPLGLACAHFAACLSVARTVAVRRLTWPRGFEELPARAAALASDWQD